MSAAALREAARLMRERAQAATPGPWTHEHEGLQGGEVIRADDVRVARVYKGNWPTWQPDCENADYIASMHPAVALAVADWLDAERAGACCDDCLDDPSARTPGQEHALTVARAYLGGDS